MPTKAKVAARTKASARKKPSPPKMTREMEAKINSVVADRYLYGFKAKRPNSPNDLDFDREAAIKILCEWGARVISVLDDLYDSFDDVSTALERSQDMFDLFGERRASAIRTIASELDRMSSDAFLCVPHLMDLPDTSVLRQPMLRK